MISYVVHHITILLTLTVSHISGGLYAGCKGCSRGQSLVSEGTATAAAAGLSGLPGAAGLPGLSGVAGATGATGTTGATGATGATGSTGGLIDYAFIYRATSDGGPQTIPGGSKVLFNTDGVFASGTTFTHSTGSANLAIHSTGTYLARYKLIILLAHTNSVSSFAFALNSGSGDVLLAGSDRSTDIAPGAASLTMVGECIFTISSTPPAGGDLLSVINAGGTGLTAGATTDIGADNSGTTTAAITSATLCIQKIGN
jgi:hypothetical protein